MQDDRSIPNEAIETVNRIDKLMRIIYAGQLEGVLKLIMIFNSDEKFR